MSLQVNDDAKGIRMTIISDAPSYGITYNCHFVDSTSVIYSPGVINYALREHL
jgi:hypothetical protein